MKWLALWLQAADLQKACAISRDDPGSDLAPSQADFQERVHSLAAQLMQVRVPVRTCLDKPLQFETEHEPLPPHLLITSWICGLCLPACHRHCVSKHVCT